MYYLVSIAYKDKQPKKVITEDVKEIDNILLDINSNIVAIQVEIIEK